MGKEEIPEGAYITLFRKIVGVLGPYCSVWSADKQHSHHPGACQKCGGSIPDLRIRACSVTNPQVTGVHVIIRKRYYNSLHPGEEFKTDHLESFLDYTSLTRSKLINVGVGVPGHAGWSIVQYYDQANKLVPKVIV